MVSILALAGAGCAGGGNGGTRRSSGAGRDKPAGESTAPQLTEDGRVIVRGQGIAYAIRPPTGWVARSVLGADRSTKSTVTVADLAPPDGSPVSISGQLRSKNRDIDSIEDWVNRVSLTRRAGDEEFALRRAGPVVIDGRRTGEMIVLDAGPPHEDNKSSVDHEAVVLIDEPDVIIEIFLTTKTRELRDLHLSTLRAVAATYGPAG
ncbi:MAG TPA: hypothetical protein VJ890_09940 [Vineibacter sp.]|nr:hypothetical protein [Vineibacter sp.]